MRELTTAGVDAVIVQDLGLVRLIRAITPDLEIHASTQMSITSDEGVALARELGCSRVILARELALPEISRIREAIDFPLEVFVHGALCVAYSGQCLTSEALGGRSANRGECAQACRMPYQIVSDGRLVDLDNVQYLLSPQDLAAYDLVPQLIEIGRRQPQDRRPAEDGRVRRQHHAPLPDGDRCSLGRAAGLVHAPRRPGDAALVFARLLPRLPGRHQPQGAGARRPRQEAGHPARRGGIDRPARASG